MGDAMTLTTSKTKVGQGGAVGCFFRPATLPHHPTPNGVVGWWGGMWRRRSDFRGGARGARSCKRSSEIEVSQ